MTKLELRELVKSHFSLVDSPEAQTFAEAKLIDGTVIKTDGAGGFEVGQKAKVVTADGTEVDAPAGEHILEDDTVLVIDGEGTITGVKTKDEAGEGSLTEMSEEEVTEETVEAPAEEFAEEDIAEAVIEEAVDAGMTPDDVIETVKAVIEEVIAPQMEEMKKKMAEYEMAYKEKMSEPASVSAQEKRFASIQKVKANVGNEKTFNAKQAQLEAFLNKKK